jgi:hypothetical protein
VSGLDMYMSLYPSWSLTCPSKDRIEKSAIVGFSFPIGSTSPCSTRIVLSQFCMLAVYIYTSLAVFCNTEKRAIKR